MYRLKKNLVLIAALLLPLISTGCLIEEVIQSLSVETGGMFSSTLIVSDMTAETTNPHKGALMVLVPDDWTFVSGTYEAQTAGGSETGIMVLNPGEPVYGDIDTVIPPPLGMKWVDILSDTGYLTPADAIFEVTVNFEVGQLTGDFAIGYAVTKNTQEMLGSLNPEDEDNTSAWTDTSMNHMVTVMPGTGVKETVLNGMPSEYHLSQNFPNPFNPSTTINYSVVEGTEVSFKVYDVSGKEVATLVNGFKPAGNYSINYSDKSLSSGIYYYRITMNGFTETRKMILMK
jgi:hypothetical protein